MVPFSESITPPLDLFPFLQLPAEIRNQIYELLLTNQRNPSSRVIHGNNLMRRQERRSRIENRAYAFKSGMSTKSLTLARRYLFLNSTHATISRLQEPMAKPELTAPLLDTNILSVCKQTYREGMHILYLSHIFAVIVADQAFGLPVASADDRVRHPTYFTDALPPGVDISRIRYLRIELQIGEYRRYNPKLGPKFDTMSDSNYFLPCTWSRFCRMRNLKSLQIVVTFRGDHQGANSSLSKATASNNKTVFERA